MRRIFYDQKVGGDIYIASGEESLNKLTFSNGDYVHLSHGMNQGVKEGDLFTVTGRIAILTRFPV